MTDHSTIEWPDYCCVPALVADAAEFFGRPEPSPRGLSSAMGVRVPLDVDNPFDLPVETPDFPAGVDLRLVVKKFPGVATKFDLGLSMDFIPFNKIPWADYEGEYLRIQDEGAYIGVGLDWLVLAGVLGRSFHVVRVMQFDSQSVVIVDPTDRTRAAHKIEVRRFEGAVVAAGGGFIVLRRAS